MTEFTLWQTGEAWPSGMALRRQLEAQGEALYGRAYLSQQFGRYKLAGIRTVAPTAVAVGSSRVMQFRDFMLEPLRFYNAGGLLQSAFDLEAYAGMVATQGLPAPRLLIVGIDPWWFKAGYGDDGSWLDEDDEAFSFAARVRVLRRLVAEGDVVEFLGGVWQPRESPYWKHYAIGGLAMRQGNGFRKDGSRQYSPSILAAFIESPVFIDREDPPIIERIERQVSPFGTPAVFDTNRAEVVLLSLEQLRAQGIEVWAFMPPFSGESLMALDMTVALRAWWSGYRGFADRLRAAGFPVVPVASPLEYGLDDRFMLDGFHPSEVFVAHIIRDMAHAAAVGSALREIDIRALEHRIELAQLPLAFDLPW